MKKLPENFSLEKYGLKVRLVNENDAEFILSLRANPNRTKYMITLDYDIERQKKWIQEYKKREKKGLDFYFIYSNNEDRPIGVNRISHVDINSKTAKFSSLIVVEGLKYEALIMVIIMNEIAFHSLGIDMYFGDVHKKNSRVFRILDLFGYIIEDLGTEYYQISLTKSDYLKACESSVISKLKANESL